MSDIKNHWDLFSLIESLLNIYWLNYFYSTEHILCSYLYISGQRLMNTQTLSANSQLG